MTTTATLIPATEPSTGGRWLDRLYVHGADIADPHNDRNVTWDYSGADDVPVYVVEVEASEDEAPYVAALAEHGLTVVGQDPLTSDWILTQSRPL